MFKPRPNNISSLRLTHSNFTTTNFRLPPFSPHLPPIEKELNYTKGKRRENNARRRWENQGRSTRRGSGKWKPKWKRKRNEEKGLRSSMIRNTTAHSIAAVVDVVVFVDTALPSLFSLNQLLGLGL